MLNLNLLFNRFGYEFKKCYPTPPAEYSKSENGYSEWKSNKVSEVPNQDYPSGRKWDHVIRRFVSVDDPAFDNNAESRGVCQLVEDFKKRYENSLGVLLDISCRHEIETSDGHSLKTPVVTVSGSEQRIYYAEEIIKYSNRGGCASGVCGGDVVEKTKLTLSKDSISPHRNKLTFGFDSKKEFLELDSDYYFSPEGEKQRVMNSLKRSSRSS